MGRPSKFYGAHDEMLPQNKIIPLSEVGDPGPIELVSDVNFVPEAELESFMNELVTIRLHQSATEGDLLIETPAVNGVNMPIMRGKPQAVKRKYVEALAQSRIITYAQQQLNPADMSDISMVERSTLKYPFEVLHDPNPIGRQWLDAVLAAQ